GATGSVSLCGAGSSGGGIGVLAFAPAGASGSGVASVAPTAARRSSDSSVDDEKYARVRLVTKKMAAVTHVVFVKKLPAPRPPKTCCAAAPENAPSPPLLPGCRSTTSIRKMHATTCTTVMGVVRISIMARLSTPKPGGVPLPTACGREGLTPSSGALRCGGDDLGEGVDL